VRDRSGLDTPTVGYGVFLNLVAGLLNILALGWASHGWANETRSDRLLQIRPVAIDLLREMAQSSAKPLAAQHLILRDAIAQSVITQSLVGQCRRTGRLERIYDAANLAANAVGDLESGVVITLAGEVNQPAFGWIRISAPLDGYIQAAFLNGCDGGIAPSLDCGIVTQSELALKPSASTLSDPIGTLLFEQGFNITGAPQMQSYPPSQAGRMWVPIDRFGTTGWVTESAPDSYGNNFRRVPCGSIGLEPLG